MIFIMLYFSLGVREKAWCSLLRVLVVGWAREGSGKTGDRLPDFQVPQFSPLLQLTIQLRACFLNAIKIDLSY